MRLNQSWYKIHIRYQHTQFLRTLNFETFVDFEPISAQWILNHLEGQGVELCWPPSSRGECDKRFSTTMKSKIAVKVSRSFARRFFLTFWYLKYNIQQLCTCSTYKQTNHCISNISNIVYIMTFFEQIIRQPLL